MPSGDSISKYDTSRDLYSVRLSPIQQKKNLDVTLKKSSKLDSIETAREKNERINPIKVTPKSMNAAGEQAVKIARAGRFVFYAIAMPPFFLFYTVPKWVTLTVLPPLIFNIKKKFKYAEIFIKNILKRINETMMSPFRNLFGKISWKNSKIEKQGTSLLAYLSQNFLKMRGLIEKGFKVIASVLNQKAIVPLQHMREIVQEKLREIFKESKKIFHKYSSLFSHYSEIVKKTYMAGIQPVLHMLTPYIQVIQKPLELALGWGRGVLSEKVMPVIRSCIERSGEIVAEALNKFSSKFTQIAQNIQPVINYLAMTPIQFLKKHLSFSIQWLKDKPKEKYAKFALAVRKCLNAISPHLNDTLDRSIDKIMTFLGPLYKLALWIVRKILSVLKLLWGFAKMLGLMFYKRFHRLLDPLKKKICRLYAFFIAELKAMVKAPIAYFWQVFKKLVTIFLQGLKICALIIIAIALVFKFWFKMMYELSEGFVVKKS